MHSRRHQIAPFLKMFFGEHAPPSSARRVCLNMNLRPCIQSWGPEGGGKSRRSSPPWKIPPNFFHFMGAILLSFFSYFSLCGGLSSKKKYLCGSLFCSYEWTVWTLFGARPPPYKNSCERFNALNM